MANKNSLQSLEARLTQLENRVAQLEQGSTIRTRNEDEQDYTAEIELGLSEETRDRLESKIGQFWLARVGVSILVIGIGLALVYPYQHIPPLAPVLFGYVLAVILLVLGIRGGLMLRYLRNYLQIGSAVILYFSTMRLHYFSPVDAQITSHSLVLALLLVSAVAVFVTAITRGSELMAIMAMFLLAVTAALGTSFPILVGVLWLTNLLALFYGVRNNWSRLHPSALSFSLLSFLIWFIALHPADNPFALKQIGLLGIMLVAVIAGRFRTDRSKEQPLYISTTAITAFLGYSVYLALSFAGPLKTPWVDHLIAAVLFQIAAIYYWVKEESRYATFIYAMTGYFALSIAIMSYFSQPLFFIVLCWQSLLVLSTAYWFRSRFIVSANTVIYLFLLLGFLAISETVPLSALSFGLVALISARILNWQKTRLDLKTDLMRNIYLGCAFVILPWVLNKTVPDGYISLSWTGLSVFYFAMSLLLQNKKYRWMALGNLLITLIYVFVFDLTHLAPELRILSFLVLGLVLLALSLTYARRAGKSKGGRVDN